MQHFEFFLKGEDFKSGSKARRVYFATEFIYDQRYNEGNNNSGDESVQIYSKGTIFGDIAIQARNLDSKLRIDELKLQINYLLPKEQESKRK
ncbi:unnamed protein product [Trichobilharzia regenti]|nr:unnamed protein product [Trichobilharzia regenti]